MTGTKNRNKHPADDAEAERSEGGDPVEETCRELENNLKKWLTTARRCDNLYRLSLEADREGSRKDRQKKMKKFLTKRKRFDKISKLSQERTARTLITEQ